MTAAFHIIGNRRRVRAFALPFRSMNPAAISTRLLTRMRSWFAVDVSPAGYVMLSDQKAAPAGVVREMHRAKSISDARVSPDVSRGNVVIQFPLNGYALLNHLAQELKSLFIEIGLDNHEPVSLRVTGGALPCLWIDSSSYVEYRGSDQGYAIVFDGAFQMRMMFEVLDRDEVSRLVRAYIVARLVEASNSMGSDI